MKINLDSILNKGKQFISASKRKVALSAATLFALTQMNAQEANGTVIFNTQANNTISTPLVNAQATKLNGADTGNIYTIAGNTNSQINIGPWTSESLGVEEFNTGLENYFLRSNPSGELDAFIKGNANNVKAEIYNVQGQRVLSPQIIDQGNGTSEIYANFNRLSQGMYFIKASDGNKVSSFKFFNDGSSTYGPSGITSAITQKLEEKINNTRSRPSTTQNANKTMSTPNYRFSWDEIGLAGNSKILAGNKDLLVEQGNNNALSIDMTLYENKTGDVVINPRFKGSPQSNTTITLTNTQVRDSTYTIITTPSTAGVIFYNLFVGDNTAPTSYEVKIVDNKTDGTFLETNTTLDIYQDNGRIDNPNETINIINGSKIINLNEIPNVQDITTTIYNSSTLAKESGVSVNLLRDSDNVVIDTQVSDANGNVLFNDIPGSTSYHLKNSKSGFYTKTNGTFSTPLVDHISEMSDSMNVTAIPKFNYAAGGVVAAADIQKYMPEEYNTEFLLGHLNIYFPPINGGNQIYKDHFAEVASELGFPGAIIPSDTPFPTPTQAQINGYNPYPQNREVYPGLIGTNITNYGGTSTGNEGKILSNGNHITFYTSGLALGGLDWSDTDHELGNVLGFPLFAGNTSRNPDAAGNTTIADSPQDTAIMPLWLNLGKYHYDTTDAQNKMIEYNITTHIDE